MQKRICDECPKCHEKNFGELAEEIDIGVGIQKFLVGGECSKCGLMSICNMCEAWDFEKHQKWCCHENKNS